jgi:hypothetical protein
VVVNLFKVFDAKQDLNTGDDIMRVLTHIRDLADNDVAGTRKSPCFLHLSASFGVWSSQNWALFIWSYALAWFLANDCVKLLACRIFDPVKSGSVSDGKRLMPLAPLKGST